MIQRISVLLTCCLLQFATAVLAQSASDTPTADGLLDSRRTVWYDRDANENQPTVSNWKYLENRRALVGSGCTVNKLVSAVGVGEWADSLGNITNEDLSDYAPIYMSHIIYAALLKGMNFRPLKVKDYKDWGTYKDWRDNE